jgi:hypothetical protein
MLEKEGNKRKNNCSEKRRIKRKMKKEIKNKKK